MNIKYLIEQESWQAILELAHQSLENGMLRSNQSQAAFRAATQLGRESEAEFWVDQSLALNPENATMWRSKGRCFQLRQEWPQALEHYEKAVALKPDVPAFQAASAFAAFQLGRYELAVERYQGALQGTPDVRAHWIRLARSLIHLGRLQEAEQAYARALALQDDAATRSARLELLRQIRSGLKAPSHLYYDEIFAGSTKYNQAAEESEYAPIWQQLVAQLNKVGAKSILDLGCGPGQFAEYLVARLTNVAYAGIDFSGVAIARARERVPQYLFECGELPLSDFSQFPKFDAVVCTEVLEHVEADREILVPLPKGTHIVATVPNFDAFGHLRIFRNEEDIRVHYGDLIDHLEIKACPISSTNVIWILTGVRSSHSLTTTSVTSIQAGGNEYYDAEPGQPVDLILWSDKTSYVEDFLAQFGLPFTTVEQSRKRQYAHVALRHDVDWSIEQALAMAEVEYSLGVQSSYYLLHPDGGITPKNYFGYVDQKGKLIIDPQLFKAAGHLLDLGHEVGLHNDLISLALNTRRQPAEFLEQIVEAFRKNGIPLTGSVAHGSKMCGKLGYVNYQIFKECERNLVDSTKRNETMNSLYDDCVTFKNHKVCKYSLSMSDFELEYEANFVPKGVYISDSSARWAVSVGEDCIRFDGFTDKASVQVAIGQALARKSPMEAVQCLVHADHWSVLNHYVPSAIPKIQKRSREIFARKTLDATLKR